MSKQETTGSDFEERLLRRLKAVVAKRGAAAAASEGEAPAPRGPRRRRPVRLALAGAAALAIAALVLILSSGGDNASKAFAVEPQAGGGVTIKIYSLEDASGVEAALNEAGIRSQVTWLDAGMVCREPHYKPSKVHSAGERGVGTMTTGGPGAITISVGAEPRSRVGEYKRGEISDAEFQASLEERANVNLDPKAFRPDQSVIISGAPVPYNGDPEGGSITKIDVAEGTVEPCEPVPAPPGVGTNPFALTQEGGPGYTPEGDSSLGPDAAAAADLRRAAAGSSGTELAAPGPGKFLYEKTKVIQLEGWLPKGDAKGSKDHPRYFVPINDPKARYALVPRTKQVWTARSGKAHVTETLGKIRFLSGADQRTWEEAGSPPPWAFDPTEHHVARDDSGRLEKAYSRLSFRGRHEFKYLGRLATLPTEPEALRVKIEHRPSTTVPVAPSPATSARGGGTVESLLEILGEPLTPPAVRAAAFGALAEIPGLGFEREVIDGAGRRGDAIGWTRGEGFGNRYIFDPRTGRLLAESEMIFGPPSSRRYGVPDGTVFRETAYLRSGIVGSTDEMPGGATGGMGDNRRPPR
jgi:hypothetical protein